MAAKGSTIMLAGVVGIGLGMLALVDRPERPSTGVVVVAGPATAPAQGPDPLAPAPMPASLEPTPPAEGVAAEASAAPANYTYWEGGDPGVWGTPATFSAAR